MVKTYKSQNPYLYFSDDGKYYRADYVVSLGGIALSRKNKKGKYNQINANSPRCQKIIQKHNLYSKLRFK